ncbi:uncharacterized protein LOC110980388 [Acanthaster planci]|uniref:Uncharacterized protein LOC110980388 n=1 Tax=Acanthaster planci TaxID=133434 RepID=A0A8B7YML1_ACAPL|nr:uncharacterized protein LOC110980388 [Acanthaster planci]
MDVKPGHCWRCEKLLPEHAVRCDRCPKAMYCSDPCKKRDRVRHGAVECQVFGPQSCSHCEKTGDLKQCSACNNAWYCDAKCQRKNWAAHKSDCKSIQEFIEDLSHELTKQYTELVKHDVTHTRERVLDPPYYFGSTMAYDFLQLEQNEWADGINEEETARDFNILSAGCGDLRNTVLTAASLPAKYRGKLSIVLNDLDPYVMARNVLFLYMMIRHSDSAGIATSLATIWYSLHISKTDYNLIKANLEKLIQADAKSLQEVTRGSVVISNKDLAELRKVWHGWNSLQCERIKSSSINLNKQRQAVLEEIPFFGHELQLCYERLTPKEADDLKKWFQHGLFLPDNSLGRLPFNNPTLTGRKQQIIGAGTMVTEDFVYCIHRNLTPFTAWDCLQVRQSTEGTTFSTTAMYHNYVVQQLQKTIILFAQGRLHIHILVSSFLDVPHHHQALQMAKFDRIFTSNLADYVGFRKLLKVLGSLVNPNNKNARLVTETMNWISLHVPEPNIWGSFSDIDIHELTKETMQLCKDDTGKELSSPLAISHQLEYFNNTHWFLAYLRANMMAGSLHIPELDHTPSLKEAMKCEGLQMHDFREEINRLVPFQFRVNARSLTSPTGAQRAVEWFIPSDHRA